MSASTITIVGEPKTVGAEIVRRFTDSTPVPLPWAFAGEFG
jgi:hypothetical protein